MARESDEARRHREREAKRKIALWRSDPVAFVREQFGVEPDLWQINALRSFRDNKRTALIACKGPGKSAVSSWCAWWALACHVDAQGIALSITASNLADGLWKELAFWRQKSDLLQRVFEVTAERIFAKDRQKTWWLSARSFPKQADREQQANTLAGLHAEHVFVLLDEFGDYPEGVLPAAEGIFANDVWNRILVVGNPTRTGGSLHRVATIDSAQWNCIHITGDPNDPERSPRISIEWANEQITKWGRDNPWVMANVLGLFPPSSSDQLISIDVVLAAQKRDLPRLHYQSDPVVWGLDPSRFGDDEATLARRQGVLARTFNGHTWRGLDGVQLASRVAQLIEAAVGTSKEPDALFVDVGGIGASCYDHLKYLGYKIVHPVDFGSRPDMDTFADKRSEMWWNLSDWLKKIQACLPNDPILQAELTAPKMDFRVVQKRTVFVLESKRDMKRRGISSPNRADALALTFAAPLAKIGRKERSLGESTEFAVTKYNPYERK